MTDIPKRQRGRPRKPEKAAQNRLQLYFDSGADLQMIAEIAEQHGLRPSEWARSILLREVRREKERA